MKETFEYIIKKASDFSKDEVDLFKKTVIEAGEVSEATFDGLIAKNPTLIFIPNTLKIEAVGALKIPNDHYKLNVFTQAQSPESQNEFEFELGWIVSLIPGNGKKLTRILSSYRSNIYATVRQANEIMKHILTINGFIKSGNKYKSNRNDYYLELYIKKQAD